MLRPKDTLGIKTCAKPVSGFSSSTPPPFLCRHKRPLPALVLFALLACCVLLAPAPAAAQAIWSATLTADLNTTDVFPEDYSGCTNNNNTLAQCSDVLSPSTFTFRGRRDWIRFLRFDQRAELNVVVGRDLNISFGKPIPEAVRRFGVLTVDSQELGFAGRTFSTQQASWSWNGDTRIWTQDQRVSLSLTLRVPDSDPLRRKYDWCFNRDDMSEVDCASAVVEWESQPDEINLTDSSKHCPRTHARRVAKAGADGTIKCQQSFYYDPDDPQGGSPRPPVDVQFGPPGGGGGPAAPGGRGEAGGSGGGTVSPGGGGGGSSGGTDPGQPSATCPRGDRSALERFYQQTGGNMWHENGNWNSPEPLGQWFGVGTNEENVVSLRLADNGLAGDMPRRDLLCLSGLVELALWGNDGLRGDIPDELNLAAERAALRDVAEALSLNTEWFNDYDEPFEFEQWHGGVTTDDDGKVTELDFTGEGIRGEIPGSVFELQRLEEISLGCGVTLEEEAPGGVNVMDVCEETPGYEGGGCALGAGGSSVPGLFLAVLLVFATLAGRRARG